MFNLKEVPLPDYTRREDIANSITHVLGVPFFTFATIDLLMKISGAATTKHIIGIFLYTFSSLVVFLGSTIYHGLRPGYAKKAARVIDHSNIYFMISGSLTAVSLADYKGTADIKYTILVIFMWVLSFVGVFLTFMDLKKFNNIQIVMYVLMGWTMVFGLKSIYPIDADGKRYVLTVLAGGICVTIGTILYFVGKKHRYFHAVFHVFVLIGSIIIFMGTYNFNKAIFSF